MRLRNGTVLKRHRGWSYRQWNGVKFLTSVGFNRVVFAEFLAHLAKGRKVWGR